MATDAAFLLVSFGGPEGPDDVHAVPAQRHCGPQRARRAAGSGRRALLTSSAGSARSTPSAATCSARSRRTSPPAASTCRSTGATGTGSPTWPTPCARWPTTGSSRAIALATSAYSSFSSCRQYLDDIDRARAAVGPTRREVVKIPPYYRHPGFVGSFTDAARRALASPAATDRGPRRARLHRAQHPRVHGGGQRPGAAEPTRPSWPRLRAWWPPGSAGPAGSLPTQSRSGPPSVPWLEPDISDCLADLAGPDRGRSWLCRSGSSAITWRSSSTWTSRRHRRPAAWPGDGQGRHAGHRPAVRRDDLLAGQGLRAAGPGDAAEALGPQAQACCREGCCGAGPRPARAAARWPGS